MEFLWIWTTSSDEMYEWFNAYIILMQSNTLTIRPVHQQADHGLNRSRSIR